MVGFVELVGLLVELVVALLTLEVDFCRLLWACLLGVCSLLLVYCWLMLFCG